MGHKNKKSLKKQIEDVLTSKLAIGRKKHEDKAAEEGIKPYIYSYETLRGYLKQSCYFADYCKAHHKVRTLEDCRQYVDEFLQRDIDKGLSSYTIKLRAAALAKLYGCSTKDFILTPPRKRSEITRSRGARVRDKHVSQKNNAELITFLQATGLRRREVTTLTGDCFTYYNGKPCIYVRNGKGGRERYAPIADNVDTIREMMQQKGTGKVFDHISGMIDVHGYRSEYATKIYEQNARPLHTLSQKQKYYCRGELRGVIYDKQAMMIASNALGHNRLYVIADHYLRAVDNTPKH